MSDLNQLAEQLVNLTVKDVKELADILKETYGIEPAAAAVAVAATGGAGGGEEAAAKTEFDVMLNSAGSAKLKVVKEINFMLRFTAFLLESFFSNTEINLKSASAL